MTRYTCGFFPGILAIIPATRYTCVFLPRILAFFPALWGFYSQENDYFLTNAQIYAHEKSLCIQLFREKLSEKMCTRQSRKVIWDMIDILFLTTVAVEPTLFLSVSTRKHIFMARSCQFFQISLRNGELKTTHNACHDCRVHFFRQPFSK